MGMMINRRRVCGGKSLPYDAEIEYLESSGTQYIDTGIMVNIYNKHTHRFVIDVEFLTSSGWKLQGSANNGRDSFYIGYNRIGNFYYGNGSDYGSDGLSFYGRKMYDLDTLSGTLVVKNDSGTVLKDIIINAGSSYTTDGLPIWLFGYSGESVKNSSRIYSSTIYVNNVIVRNLIPVRVNQVGYMYDKVSGQLFGNAGTGDFILGPDK